MQRESFAEEFEEEPIQTEMVGRRGQTFEKHSSRIVLGQGSFGKVFRAWEKSLGDIAVKEIPLDKAIIKEIEREIIIPSDLDHENIIRYHGWSSDEETLRLFMEIIQGGNLVQHIRHYPLTHEPIRLLNYTKQILNGLDYLHKRDIVHRDIKGDNILVVDAVRPVLKIADFGLSFKLSGFYQTTGLKGTPPYMAPEVIKSKGKNISKKADIFSLGCVVIEMFSGCSVHRTLMSEAGTELAMFRLMEEPLMPTIPDVMPENAQAFVQRCLSKEPEMRPGTTELLMDPFMQRCCASGMDVQMEQKREQSQKQSETEEAGELQVNMYRYKKYNSDILRPRSICQSIFINTEIITRDMETPAPPRSGDGVGTGPAEHDASKLEKESQERDVEQKTFRELVQQNISSSDLWNQRTWAEAIGERLTQPELESRSWLDDLIHLEEVLRDMLRNQPPKDSPLLISLYTIYTTTSSVLRMALLMGKVTYKELKPMLKGKDDLMEALHKVKIYLNDNSPYDETYLQVIKNLLDLILNRDEARKMWDSKRLLPPSRSSSATELFATVYNFCQDETLSEPGTAIRQSFLAQKSRIDRLLCIGYLGLQAIQKRKPGTLLKELLREEYIKLPDQLTTVTLSYILVSVLSRINDSDRCEKILGKNEGQEMGLRGLLKPLSMDESVHLPVCMSLCQFLQYHDRENVRQIVNIHDEEDLMNYHQQLLMRIFRNLKLNLKPDVDSKPTVSKFTYAGKFGNNMSVLVKVLKKTKPRSGYDMTVNTETHSWVNEWRALLHLSDKPHQNLVRLAAFQKKEDPFFMLIETVLPSHPLDRFLKERRKSFPKMTLEDLLLFVLRPVVDVVSYCHRNNLVIRNLTAQNFVIREAGQELQLKLERLEAARVLQQDQAGRPSFYYGKRTDPVPLLWCAPETILDCEYSTASDAYMLGHTSIEILTMGCPAYYQRKGIQAENIILQMLLHGIIPGRPTCIPQRLYTSLAECFVTTPSSRKTADDLLKDIDRFLTEQDKQCLLKADCIYEPPGDECLKQQRERIVGTPKKFRGIIDILQGVYKTQNPKLQDILCCTIEEAQTEKETISDPDEPQIYSASGYYAVSLRCPLDQNHLNALLKLRHPNITRIESQISLDKGYFLCMSYTGGQSLLDYAWSQTYDPDQLDELLTLFSQVAGAMEYLHQQNILHCNLRADYVFVTHDPLQAKVGHFGRSLVPEFGDYESRLSDVVTTPGFHQNPVYKISAARWQPREVNMSGQYSMYSDVASWGIMVWETLTVFAAPPAKEGSRRDDNVPYPNIAASKVAKRQSRRHILPQPEHCPEWIYRLIRWCNREPSHKRPTFEEVCMSLQERGNDLEGQASEPQDPFRDDENLYTQSMEQDYTEERDLRIWEVRENLYRELEKTYSDFSITLELGRLMEERQPGRHSSQYEDPDDVTTAADRYRRRPLPELPPAESPLQPPPRPPKPDKNIWRKSGGSEPQREEVSPVNWKAESCATKGIIDTGEYEECSMVSVPEGYINQDCSKTSELCTLKNKPATDRNAREKGAIGQKQIIRPTEQHKTNLGGNNLNPPNIKCPFPQPNTEEAIYDEELYDEVDDSLYDDILPETYDKEHCEYNKTLASSTTGKTLTDTTPCLSEKETSRVIADKMDFGVLYMEGRIKHNRTCDSQIHVKSEDMLSLPVEEPSDRYIDEKRVAAEEKPENLQDKNELPMVRKQPVSRNRPVPAPRRRVPDLPPSEISHGQQTTAQAGHEHQNYDYRGWYQAGCFGLSYMPQPMYGMPLTYHPTGLPPAGLPPGGVPQGGAPPAFIQPAGVSPAGVPLTGVSPQGVSHAGAPPAFPPPPPGVPLTFASPAFVPQAGVSSAGVPPTGAPQASVPPTGVSPTSPNPKPLTSIPQRPQFAPPPDGNIHGTYNPATWAHQQYHPYILYPPGINPGYHIPQHPGTQSHPGYESDDGYDRI